jgi:hypothetical protein
MSRLRTLRRRVDLVDEQGVRLVEVDDDEVSVRDGRRVDAPLERFDRHAVYPPGRHRAVIDLGQLARGTPPVAPLDMHAVQSFHIIVDPTPEPREIKVHRVWLE